MAKQTITIIFICIVIVIICIIIFMKITSIYVEEFLPEFFILNCPLCQEWSSWVFHETSFPQRPKPSNGFPMMIGRDIHNQTTLTTTYHLPLSPFHSILLIRNFSIIFFFGQRISTIFIAWNNRFLSIPFSTIFFPCVFHLNPIKFFLQQNYSNIGMWLKWLVKSFFQVA